MPTPEHARILNPYEAPSLKKLKPEEAKQFLLQHAKLGDTGAKDLLALVLPSRENSIA